MSVDTSFSVVKECRNCEHNGERDNVFCLQGHHRGISGIIKECHGWKEIKVTVASCKSCDNLYYGKVVTVIYVNNGFRCSKCNRWLG